MNGYQIDILEYFIKKLYSPYAKKLSESLAQEYLMKFECSADKGGYQYHDQGYWIMQNNVVTKLVTCGKNVLRTSS